MLLNFFNFISVRLLAQGYAAQVTLSDLREYFRLVSELEQPMI
jgi:hypothetical protein